MQAMEIIFMTFMIVVAVIALFAVLVILRDIIKEIANAKKEKAQQPVPVEPVVEAVQPKVVPVIEEPAEAPVIEEPIVEVAIPPEAEEVAVTAEAPAEEPAEEPVETPAEEPVEEADEGSVRFSAGQQMTIEEKYLELSSEAKGWFDEIVKYAAAVEGSKRFKNLRYEEYKVGNNRLVRILIKRGVIHCEFILHNSNFKNYVSENKISVKQAPTTMKIESEAAVEAVKSSIDIVVASIAEEKEYKKQMARERRKAARAAKAEAEEKEGE